jgi:hypothetical protein
VKFLGQEAFCAPSSRLFFVYLSWFPIESSVKVRLLYGSVKELFDAKFSISNGEVF